MADWNYPDPTGKGYMTIRDTREKKCDLRSIFREDVRCVIFLFDIDNFDYSLYYIFSDDMIPSVNMFRVFDYCIFGQTNGPFIVHQDVYW